MSRVSQDSKKWRGSPQTHMHLLTGPALGIVWKVFVRPRIAGGAPALATFQGDSADPWGDFGGVIPCSYPIAFPSCLCHRAICWSVQGRRMDKFAACAHGHRYLEACPGVGQKILPVCPPAEGMPGILQNLTAQSLVGHSFHARQQLLDFVQVMQGHVVLICIE